jgi:hypothetical protein
MKHWIKLLVTIALAVSIPLQGFAAVIMPACNTSNASMSDKMSMPEHSATMEMDQSSDESMPCDNDCCKQTGSNHTCADQKCFTCHLSVFNLPDTKLLLLVDQAAMTYNDLISEPYQIYSPPPFHPPKPISI